jgi:adenine-specific DNA-methyltransferase
LIFQWLYNRGKRKGEMLELYQEPLSVIPIPLIITKNKKKIEDVEILVNKIFDAKQDNKDIDTKELENQIDELVMDLYELNDEEKKIIRNSIK